MPASATTVRTRKSGTLSVVDPQQQAGRGGGEADRDARGHPDPAGEADRERADQRRSRGPGRPVIAPATPALMPEALAHLLEDRAGRGGARDAG